MSLYHRHLFPFQRSLSPSFLRPFWVHHKWSNGKSVYTFTVFLVKWTNIVLWLFLLKL